MADDREAKNEIERLESPRHYTVRISAEFAEAYRDWRRVKSIDADWVKVVPHGDGTAEVLFHNSERPR
jgi:hypothetical protein